MDGGSPFWFSIPRGFCVPARNEHSSCAQNVLWLLENASRFNVPREELIGVVRDVV